MVRQSKNKATAICEPIKFQFNATVSFHAMLTDGPGSDALLEKQFAQNPEQHMLMIHNITVGAAKTKPTRTECNSEDV